jgi:hypothetical protein
VVGTPNNGPAGTVPARPAFNLSQQVPICYVVNKAGASYIKGFNGYNEDDGTNGYILDARVWTSTGGGGGSGSGASVSEGGTGQTQFSQGLIWQASTIGTTALATVPATNSGTLGLGIQPQVNNPPGGQPIDVMQIGGGTVANGATALSRIIGSHAVMPGVGGGTVSNTMTVYADAPAFGTNRYAGYFAGGLASTGVTAFPTAQATGETCYRSDLRSWFMWDGGAWRQMGTPFFTTAARPASPPADFRYIDLTDGKSYRYYSGAYNQCFSRVRTLAVAGNTDVYSGTVIGAGTYTPVMVVTFTVVDPGASIDIAVNANASITNGAVVNNFLMDILVDSTTAYSLCGLNNVAASSSLVSLPGGTVNIGSLAAGSHQLSVRYYGFQQFTLSARYAGYVPFEFCRIQVFESRN